MDIQPIVIGTAGHIDHGKSTLVRALTGIDPDRLKEEKERGLTIDLGFARLPLADGRLVGLVDVPGHERFVRNMVAGATGVDLVLLVVAADDGVMPQTREHLDILRLLGVETGLVALTKVDVVDAEMVELATEDVRELVAGTFLAEAPILPVSAVTGEGVDELRAALLEAASAAEPRTAEGVFRLPVQRVFTLEGFGTIATGIPVSGEIAVGDTLELLPGRRRTKVRGLQAYGQRTDRGRAGHSVALNLSDAPRESLHRGSVVATPGYFQPVRMVGARLDVLPSAPRPVRNRMPVRLHTGTSDPRGEVVLLDRDEIPAGESGLVQVRLDEPVVCAPGDRFVLRLLSPVTTLGGGVILEESRYRLKRFKDFVLAELGAQEASLDSPEALLESVLARRGLERVSGAELGAAIKRSGEEVRRLLERLASEGRVTALGGDAWIHVDALERGRARLRSALDDHFAANPHRTRMDVRDLRAVLGLEDALATALLERAAADGEVELEAGGRVRLLGRDAGLDPALADLAGRAEAALDGYQPPAPADLAATLGTDEATLRNALSWLEDEGRVRRISGDLFFTTAALNRARDAVVTNCEEHGHLEIPALRDTLATSRKYLIPLLEHFDTTGLTLRQGPHRVLKTT